MRANFIKWIGIGGLLLSTLGISAEIPMYFQSATPPVAVFNPPAKTAIALANEAFLIKYGTEHGVLGTTAGIQGQLVVLVNDMQMASILWGKMVGAGDAYNSASGGYFRYQGDSTPFQSDWRFAGRIQIPESSTGRLVLLNGTPSIKRLMIVMDNRCDFYRAMVETVNNVPIQPTQLIAIQKIGYTGVGYEHTINGGAGALISSIVVMMNSKNPVGVFNKICPIDIYIRY